MVGSVSAYGQLQKTPANVKSAGTLTTVGAAGQVNIYTVPAGKRALLLSFVWQDINVGNGTFVQAFIGGLKSRKATLADATVVPDPAVATTNGLLLIAGDTIGFQGDALGNNGTVNYFAVIQETPA